jgi:hypothetical protein
MTTTTTKMMTHSKLQMTGVVYPCFWWYHHRGQRQCAVLPNGRDSQIASNWPNHRARPGHINCKEMHDNIQISLSNKFTEKEIE